jgi:hypothetical protein
MDLQVASRRARELLIRVDRFMLNVRPDVEPDHLAYPVEQGYAALLRMFFARLLIERPVDETTTVWSLLQNTIPDSLLSNPSVEREREYLSGPLAGTPAEVLTRLHLMNHVGPWFELQRALEAGLSEDQRNVLLLVDLNLER